MTEDYVKCRNKKTNEWMFDGIPFNMSNTVKPYSRFLEKIKKDKTFYDYEFLNYIFTDGNGAHVFDGDHVVYVNDSGTTISGSIQYNGRCLCPYISGHKLVALTYDKLTKL